MTFKWDVTFHERLDGKLETVKEKATGTKTAVEKWARQIAKERGQRFVKAVEVYA